MKTTLAIFLVLSLTISMVAARSAPYPARGSPYPYGYRRNAASLNEMHYKPSQMVGAQEDDVYAQGMYSDQLHKLCLILVFIGCKPQCWIPPFGPCVC